jgi:hypothetical protein
MSTDIKSVNISLQAAKDLMGGMLPPKRKGRTKKNLHGGADQTVSAPSQIIKLDSVPAPAPASNSIPIPTSTPSIPVPKQPVITTSPPVPTQPEPIVSATQGGGASIKPIRVELKKKHDTKKVLLQPKKVVEPVKSLKKVAAQGTRKQRKVSLGISTMHRRLTRAKKMQTRVKDMPLDKLKAQLIEKKLIKETSKAPESVLRQIAEDAQLVASKTL